MGPKLKGSGAGWCAWPLKPRIYSAAKPKSPRREQNAQQIGVNRPATSILNARFIVWRQTPARYNWPLIRVRQKVNSSLGRAFPPPFHSLARPPSPPTTGRFFLLRSRLVDSSFPPPTSPFLLSPVSEPIVSSPLLALAPTVFHLRVRPIA